VLKAAEARRGSGVVEAKRRRALTGSAVEATLGAVAGATSRALHALLCGGGDGLLDLLLEGLQLGLRGAKGTLERRYSVREDGGRLSELVLLQQTQGERGEVARHTGQQHARLGEGWG